MYSIQTDLGKALDTSFEFDDEALIFHSSGGKKGSPAARNIDYGVGLRTLFERVHVSGFSITKIIVETNNIMHLSEKERTVFSAAEHFSSPAELYSLVTAEMKNVGQRPGAKGGNSRKRLRIEFSPNTSPAEVLKAIRGLKRIGPSSGRLKAHQLKQVNSYHIWQAVQELKADPDNHNFGPSTKFDIVLDDNTCIPAKAVFGKALENALGLAALPEHFSGGVNSICNRLLSDAGYEVIKKGTSAEAKEVPIAPEDKVWAEGNVRRVFHLKRERQSGLANAKKQAFVDFHGRLFCERCQLDPIEAYGKLGNACIEVHHIVPLSDENRTPETKLDDLQCLCANCHRVVHREIKESA